MEMIQILALITLLLFAVKILRDSSYLLWLFQVKEYRLDRLRSHFKENLRINLPDLGLALGVFVLLGVFFPETARFIAVFFVLVLGALTPLLFLLSFFRLVRSLGKHSFRRPRATLKIVLISLVYLSLFSLFVYLLTAYIVQSVVILYSPDFFVLFAFYLLILSVLMPFFILLSIILVTPVANYQKRRIMQKARAKMKGMKKVKTIGIAGSFGKTSTKEFLFAILSEKYKVIKTQGNNNTNMGVANTILRDVSDDYDYFICEMGAYKVGEINEICSLALPFGGIITGLNEQHIDLFGSIENTKRAKFELAQSLPRDGFAVISEQADEMRPKVRYDVEDTVFFSKESAEDLRIEPDFVEFTYKDMRFRLNMLGKHYVENLLAAIMAAEKAGMTLDEIRSGVEKIQTAGRYLMQRLEGARGAVFIDDSYSANPTGVMAALEYLEDAYPDRKKMLVFPGIIELGRESKKIHQKIWKKADEVCYIAFLLQDEDKELRETFQKCNFVFEKDFDRMKAEIEKKIDADSVVLFESRGAGVVMNKLLEGNHDQDA